MCAKNIDDYLRVTEILRPFSGVDNIPVDILMQAAERGTQVHQLIDAINAGIGTPAIPDNFLGYMHSFEEWNLEKVYLPKPARFFDDDLKITGECDALIELDDSIVLVDFKTSAKESKSWCLQGVAYAMLAKKAGITVDKIHFVKLSKFAEKAQIFKYEYTDKAVNQFLACLEVYRYFELHKSKRVYNE